MRRVSLLLLALVAVAGIARAGKTNCRLERMDASQYDDGILKAYVSVVELDGTVVDDRGPKQFTLRANGKAIGPAQKAEKFENSNEPLDVVLVVETSALYGPKQAPPVSVVVNKDGKKAKKTVAKKVDHSKKKAPTKKGEPPPPAPVDNRDPIELIKEAAALTFLEGLHPRSRVLLIEYSADFNAHIPFRGPADVTDEVDNLSADVESSDLRLVEALRAAMRELNKPRADGKTPRRLIVVVSDGLNEKMDRKIFKSVGLDAEKARIPIHPIGFSPTDDRGPLLNLGEIAKRSNGTLRWARTSRDLDLQFENMLEEIKKQYVLTFKADVGRLDRKLFNLMCEDVESNNFVFDATKVPKGMKWYWWLLIGLGGLLVLFLIIAIIANSRSPQMVAPGYQRQGGGAMPMPGHQQQQAPAAGISARGTLIGITGTFAGQKLTIGQATYTFGKGPSTFQITDDPTVSTNHAELTFHPQHGFVISDKGSTNGTYVNDQRVAQPTVVRDGDMIKLGMNTQFKIRVE